MGAYIPLDRNGTRVPGLGSIWQSEHDFRDKHASQFTTGRFVLLPKDLVTGAAKARIVSRFLWKVITLKPRLSRGFFLADAHDASHFEAGALGRSWALQNWRSSSSLYRLHCPRPWRWPRGLFFGSALLPQRPGSDLAKAYHWQFLSTLPACRARRQSDWRRADCACMT